MSPALAGDFPHAGDGTDESLSMHLPILIALLHVVPGPTCDDPLAWQIATVDERFGLSVEDARMVVQEAAGLWETAAGQPLFEHDAERGFPISFVWDSRHQVMQDRLDREADLSRLGQTIQDQRAGLDEAREELRLERSLYDQRLEALQGRQEDHRRAIEYWESRGGPPPAEARELDRVRDELERERLRLQEKAEGINALVARVNAQTEALNEAIASYNAAQARLRGGPDDGMLTGFYRESSRALGSWTLSVSREIEIYQFDDPDHLIRAIAHELGHALGLGYLSEPRAIMYQHARSARAGQRGLGGAQLHPADVELIRSRCPLPSP